MAKKKCKSFRHDPYMTPNNYDLSFSPSEIPSNIKRENASSLKQRLQKVMPTSKIIHINYDEEPETLTEHNKCNISTKMLLNNQEVNFL